MCFSAGASFIAGTTLTTAGIIAVKKTKDRKFIAFAAIPLIFGVQQFSEGFVWLSLTGKTDSGILQPAMYIFLIFAQVVWPAWVPVSVWLPEKNTRRKKIIGIIILFGMLVSVYLARCLMVYHVEAVAENYHIRYKLYFNHQKTGYSGYFYLIPTILPLFVSSVPRMYWIGIFVLASFLTTRYFFHDELISVWCFFAAVISGLIMIMTFRLRKTDPESEIRSTS